MTDLSDLKPWATPTQAAYIDAIEKAGSLKGAARVLDKHHSTIQESMKTLKKNAAAHGYSPDEGLTRAIPAPFVARGHSTLDKINPDGTRTQMLQWTKTRLDDEAWAESIKEGVAAFIAEQSPVINAPSGPDNFETDVIPWIQIGDAHLGMLAHEAETGANFDLKIAENELASAISMLIDEIPSVERLVINDLGDFTHYENTEGVTQASGHSLDYDGRFPKMIAVYSRLMRFIVDKALEKAKFVDVIINQGNHSRTNDIWMAELIRTCYAHTGRVNVLNNHSLFIGYRMGNTFVMTHHSDKCKPNKLIDVMTTDFREDFGETEYHYIDIGHIHHGMRMQEYSGVTLESWNTLAAKDKWATDAGYRARQSISISFRSRTYGEVGRRVLPIRQVHDAIRARAHGAEHYIPPVRRAFSV